MGLLQELQVRIAERVSRLIYPDTFVDSALRDRLTEYELHNAYYSGEHKKSIAVNINQPDDNIATNFVRLAVDRSVALLLGEGVEFDLPGEQTETKESDAETGEESVTKVDPPNQQYIDEVWEANSKDILLQKAARRVEDHAVPIGGFRQGFCASDGSEIGVPQFQCDGSGKQTLLPEPGSDSLRQVCQNRIQCRGVQDILIACVDGLKGFPEAIESVYPRTRIQLCIVHLVRHSMKYVSWKDYKPVAADLKRIYQSAAEDEALQALEDLAERWDGKYPRISRSWRDHWPNLRTLFNYPADIRKAIYTTNAIESLNSVIRKVIKKRKLFPTDDAARKVIYLAIQDASKKWTMPIHNWKGALNRFMIEFEDRLVDYV